MRLGLAHPKVHFGTIAVGSWGVEVGGVHGGGGGGGPARSLITEHHTRTFHFLYCMCLV